jgi:DNA-binding transcriptional MocR family regulator
VWISLPSIDADELLQHAVDCHGVRFLPGSRCSPVASSRAGPRPHHNQMRVSFAKNLPEELEEGARRLGGAIKTFQEQKKLAAQARRAGSAVPLGRRDLSTGEGIASSRQ